MNRRLGIAALLLWAAASCGLPRSEYFGESAPPSDGRHLRFCNSGEPESFDPAYASTTVSMKLVYSLFDGLTVFDFDGLPSPGLASAWNQSSDLTHLTFQLRSNARWSNGRSIDGFDVAYQALRVLSATTASPNADALANLKNATQYLANRVAILTEPRGGLAAGTVVEIVDPAEPPDVNTRQVDRQLALRDLGTAASSAYAYVPVGEMVTLIADSTMLAVRDAPDGEEWSYVFWARDEGVYGWVKANELGSQPAAIASAPLVVRALARDRLPSHITVTATVFDKVAVEGRALLRSFDAVGVVVRDPYTVMLESTSPAPAMLQLSSNRALRPTPSEAVSRNPRHWAEPGRIVTSGPMHLSEWHRRDRTEFVRSATYWDRDNVALDRLTAFAIDDQAAATNFYYTGRCDAVAANSPPSTFLPVLSGERNQTKPYSDYYVRPFIGIYFAWINTQVVANRHLRRALAYAIDRSPMPSFLHGGEGPTAQLTPGAKIATLSDSDLALCNVTRSRPGVAMIMEAKKLCYVPPLGLDYDLGKAKEELALAKAELAGAFPSKLEYRYNAGSEGHKQIAEYLQQSWAQIGLKVELASQEWKTFVAETREGKYEIARFGNIGNFADPEAEFLVLFTCDSPDNRGKYCNPEFDRLLAEARPIADRSARNAVLAQAEQIMLNDAPIIPLYVYTQKVLIKPYVRNLAINAVDLPPLHQVWIDTSWRAGDAVPAPPGFSNPPLAAPRRSEGGS